MRHVAFPDNRYIELEAKLSNFNALCKIIYAVGRIRPDGVQLLGTAFLLNKPGFFATAAHVPGTDDKGLVVAFKAVFQNPSSTISDYQDTSDHSLQILPVQIVASDPFHDLAVLKADAAMSANITFSGADQAPVGIGISTFGYPHADHGRMVLTQQNAEIGSRILISSGGIKAKHLVLNIQSRPGQSGSPIFKTSDGTLVGVLIGSYAPGGGGGISLGGIDPHTLHQTTHAVSCEYLNAMY